MIHLNTCIFPICLPSRIKKWHDLDFLMKMSPCNPPLRHILKGAQNPLPIISKYSYLYILVGKNN